MTICEPNEDDVSDDELNGDRYEYDTDLDSSDLWPYYTPVIEGEAPFEDIPW